MTTLAELPVLVVDCQTTGATPDKGALLEVGWGVTRASTNPRFVGSEIVAHVVRLPTGESVPSRVSKITGIGPDELARATDPSQVWRDLARIAPPGTPTIIHFARFELPFLLALHQHHAAATPFPFDIICTHEIARRLLPELPRRGLRAVSGFLGHSTHALRRASAHVDATAFVWHAVVPRLAHQFGIDTLSALRVWLNEPPPANKPTRVYPMPRAKRLALPDCPGVYHMLRKNGDLLYVGKATSLKTRVNSYFRRQRGVNDRTLEMLTQARDLSFTVTETALEAALLEHDNIKRLSPPYNVALVDDGRGVWFASPTFDSWATGPDRRHPFGPFLNRQPLEELAALASALRDPSRHAPWAERIAASDNDVDIDVDAAVDVDVAACCVLGLELFRQELDTVTMRVTPTASGVGQLLHFGARNWAERLSRSPCEEQSANDNASDQVAETELQPSRATTPQADALEWTPQRVCSIARHTARSAALSIRRANWWCALTEATVVYGRRLLRLEGGQVVSAKNIGYRRPAPIPHQWPRPLAIRQASLDRSACDRLRVLTTELRREVIDRRHVELRLGPRRWFGGERLAAALRWV